MKKKRNRAGKYSINEEVNVENSEDFIITFTENDETVLDVQCGTNKARLTLEKLWQGSKGQCINFQGSWLTPNEFQYVSGRETAKDWKRSIRHQGKSIKLLLSKGYIKVTTDCPNYEQTKEVKNVQVKVKPKRRGKGDRRRAAKNKTKAPVLIDIPDHSNGKDDDTNGKINGVNRTESTDESHDGNETDETIENYYSENEYGYAKENNEKKVENKKSDKNVTDCNQNLESEKISEDFEESFETKEIPLADNNYNDETSSKSSLTENVNNGSKPTDTDVKLSDPSCNIRAVASGTKDKDKCVGAQTCTLKPLLEEQHCGGEEATVGLENTESVMDTEQNQLNSTETDCSVHPSDDTTTDAMPVIVDDIAENCQSPLDSDENSFDPASSPPVLVAQQEEMKLLEQNRKPMTEDQTENIEDSSMTNSKKFILSLPLKHNLGELPYESVENEPNTCESSSVEHTKENEKICNVPCTSENVDDLHKRQEHTSDDSKVKKDEVNNMYNGGDKRKEKRNKRKRLPKHVKKQTNINTFEKETSNFNNESTIPTECSPIERVPRVTIETEHLNAVDRKTEKPKLVLPVPNSLPSFSTNIEGDQVYSDDNTKSDNSDTRKLITKKTDTPKRTISQNKDVTQISNIPKSSSSPHENKPLINLKSTAPRQNGEIRKQSRSPVQNSYDDYMRRLEASHSSVPWSPFFPFFQAPRHLDGLGSPVSPFVSPYPPMLGSIRPHTTTLLPESIRTPTSSPLQSPFAATSPPSFEIPRIPPAPPLWYETASSNTNLKTSNSTFEYSKSRILNSENSTNSCLTIRPAHSVKPVSFCSGLKRSSTDSITPLDLSIKRYKVDNCQNSEYKASNKNKIDNVHYNSNSVNCSDDVYAKKHRKLKHLWINKTDNDSKVNTKCSCAIRNIENWSAEQVAEFINRLDGCRSYSEKFRDYGIVGRTLKSFTPDSLIRGFGMKVGPAIVLSEAITQEVQSSSRRSLSCHYCRSQPLRDEQNNFV